jgi:predicted site-specific integrase-resolvase
MTAAEVAAARTATAEELAAVYQVRPATIRAWHRAGRIPAAVAMGRILRFDPEAVARALRREAAAAERAAKSRGRLPAMLPVI